MKTIYYNLSVSIIKVKIDTIITLMLTLWCLNFNRCQQ